MTYSSLIQISNNPAINNCNGPYTIVSSAPNINNGTTKLSKTKNIPKEVFENNDKTDKLENKQVNIKTPLNQL